MRSRFGGRGAKSRNSRGSGSTSSGTGWGLGRQREVLQIDKEALALDNNFNGRAGQVSNFNCVPPISDLYSKGG